MISNEVDLTCREVTALVTEYLNRGLTAEVRAMLEQHVFACPSCTIYLSQMKTIVSLASSLGENEQEPPAAAESDVLAAFRRWKRK
ncbi:MAG TPA: zf-HC2 domain-containing protein [Polyangiales bacterium]|nr:zf-HC2 domain-containing protein [Polyangiales bacterium]